MAGLSADAARAADAPAERVVAVNGEPCRVWEKGSGAAVGFLAGLGGLPRWTPFLDALARHRRVIVPSLPGFPGATGHDRLDDHLDWIAATLDLLRASGLDGADVVGASVGGMLAAEVAALSPATVARLVLVAPFGLFDAREPTTDAFALPAADAPGVLCAHPERLRERNAPPDGADATEWSIVLSRANAAAARLLWPLGDRGLAKRLHRITAPTLLVWGDGDRVVPPSYAARFAAGIAGPVEQRTIAGAGHLVDLDAPDELARTVDAFLGARPPVRGYDHLAITVADVERTVRFYRDVLGAEILYEDEWRAGRLPVAMLQIGASRMNVHPAAAPVAPHATAPTPGSVDLCLRWDAPIEDAAALLARHGVAVIEGPVPRPAADGAWGRSVYFRDPDGNLLELLSTVTA